MKRNFLFSLLLIYIILESKVFSEETNDVHNHIRGWTHIIKPPIHVKRVKPDRPVNCDQILCPKLWCPYGTYLPLDECCPKCIPELCDPKTCKNNIECRRGTYIPPGKCCPVCKPDCRRTKCDKIDCKDGHYVAPGECCPKCKPVCSVPICKELTCQKHLQVKKPGECCPICSEVNCQESCPELNCTDEQIYLPTGECCPKCKEDCANKVCPRINCRFGSYKPEGKCCRKCNTICRVPKCAKNLSCQHGLAKVPGKCCPQCNKDCSSITCPTPMDCKYGIFIPEDSCCPRCKPDCSLVDCHDVDCPHGKFNPPGACCPKCKEDCTPPICPHIDCNFGKYKPENECCPKCKVDCSYIIRKHLCPKKSCKYGEYTKPGECCSKCLPDCSNKKCPYKICIFGEYIPVGECCPKCLPDCAPITCPKIKCSSGYYVPKNQCCPRCRENKMDVETWKVSPNSCIKALLKIMYDKIQDNLKTPQYVNQTISGVVHLFKGYYHIDEPIPKGPINLTITDTALLADFFFMIPYLDTGFECAHTMKGITNLCPAVTGSVRNVLFHVLVTVNKMSQRLVVEEVLDLHTNNEYLLAEPEQVHSLIMQYLGWLEENPLNFLPFTTINTEYTYVNEKICKLCYEVATGLKMGMNTRNVPESSVMLEAAQKIVDLGENATNLSEEQFKNLTCDEKVKLLNIIYEKPEELNVTKVIKSNEEEEFYLMEILLCIPYMKVKFDCMYYLHDSITPCGDGTVTVNDYKYKVVIKVYKDTRMFRIKNVEKIGGSAYIDVSPQDVVDSLNTCLDFDHPLPFYPFKHINELNLTVTDEIMELIRASNILDTSVENGTFKNASILRKTFTEVTPTFNITIPISLITNNEPNSMTSTVHETTVTEISATTLVTNTRTVRPSTHRTIANTSDLTSPETSIKTNGSESVTLDTAIIKDLRSQDTTGSIIHETISEQITSNEANATIFVGKVDSDIVIPSSTINTDSNETINSKSSDLKTLLTDSFANTVNSETITIEPSVANSTDSTIHDSTTVKTIVTDFNTKNNSKIVGLDLASINSTTTSVTETVAEIGSGVTISSNIATTTTKIKAPIGSTNSEASNPDITTEASENTITDSVNTITTSTTENNFDETTIVNNPATNSGSLSTIFDSMTLSSSKIKSVDHLANTTTAAVTTSSLFTVSNSNITKGPDIVETTTTIITTTDSELNLERKKSVATTTHLSNHSNTKTNDTSGVIVSTDKVTIVSLTTIASDEKSNTITDRITVSLSTTTDSSENFSTTESRRTQDTSTENHSIINVTSTFIDDNTTNAAFNSEVAETTKSLKIINTSTESIENTNQSTKSSSTVTPSTIDSTLISNSSVTNGISEANSNASESFEFATHETITEGVSLNTIFDSITNTITPATNDIATDSSSNHSNISTTTQVTPSINIENDYYISLITNHSDLSTTTQYTLTVNSITDFLITSKEIISNETVTSNFNNVSHTTTTSVTTNATNAISSTSIPNLSTSSQSTATNNSSSNPLSNETTPTTVSIGILDFSPSVTTVSAIIINTITDSTANATISSRDSISTSASHTLNDSNTLKITQIAYMTTDLISKTDTTTNSQSSNASNKTQLSAQNDSITDTISTNSVKNIPKKTSETVKISSNTESTVTTTAGSDSNPTSTTSAETIATISSNTESTGTTTAETDSNPISTTSAETIATIYSNTESIGTTIDEYNSNPTSTTSAETIATNSSNTEPTGTTTTESDSNPTFTSSIATSASNTFETLSPATINTIADSIANTMTTGSIESIINNSDTKTNSATTMKPTTKPMTTASSLINSPLKSENFSDTNSNQDTAATVESVTLAEDEITTTMTTSISPVCKVAEELVNHEAEFVRPKLNSKQDLTYNIGNMKLYQPQIDLSPIKVINPCSIYARGFSKIYLHTQLNMYFSVKLDVKCEVTILGHVEPCPPASYKILKLKMWTDHRLNKVLRRVRIVTQTNQEPEIGYSGLSELVASASREFVAAISASHLANVPLKVLNSNNFHLSSKLKAELDRSIQMRSSVTNEIGQKMLDAIREFVTTKSVSNTFKIFDRILLFNERSNFSSFIIEDKPSYESFDQGHMITISFIWSATAQFNCSINMKGTTETCPELEMVREHIHSKAVFTVTSAKGLVRTKSVAKLSGTSKMTANPLLIEDVIKDGLHEFAEKLEIFQTPRIQLERNVLKVYRALIRKIKNHRS